MTVLRELGVLAGFIICRYHFKIWYEDDAVLMADSDGKLKEQKMLVKAKKVKGLLSVRK